MPVPAFIVFVWVILQWVIRAAIQHVVKRVIWLLITSVLAIGVYRLKEIFQFLISQLSAAINQILDIARAEIIAKIEAIQALVADHFATIRDEVESRTSIDNLPIDIQPAVDKVEHIKAKINALLDEVHTAISIYVGLVMEKLTSSQDFVRGHVEAFNAFIDDKISSTSSTIQDLINNQIVERLNQLIQLVEDKVSFLTETVKGFIDEKIRGVISTVKEQTLDLFYAKLESIKDEILQRVLEAEAAENIGEDAKLIVVEIINGEFDKHVGSINEQIDAYFIDAFERLDEVDTFIDDNAELITSEVISRVENVRGNAESVVAKVDEVTALVIEQKDGKLQIVYEKMDGLAELISYYGEQVVGVAEEKVALVRDPVNEFSLEAYIDIVKDYANQMQGEFIAKYDGTAEYVDSQFVALTDYINNYFDALTIQVDEAGSEVLEGWTEDDIRSLLEDILSDASSSPTFRRDVDNLEDEALEQIEDDAKKRLQNADDEREKELERREAELEEQLKKLKDSLSKIDAREDKLNAWEAKLAKLEAEIENREKAVLRRENEAVRREDAVRKREAVTEKKEAKLAKLEAEIENRETAVIAWEYELDERDTDLKKWEDKLLNLEVALDKEAAKIRKKCQDDPAKMRVQDEYGNPVTLEMVDALGDPVTLAMVDTIGNPVTLGMVDALGNPVTLEMVDALGNPVTVEKEIGNSIHIPQQSFEIYNNFYNVVHQEEPSLYRAKKWNAAEIHRIIVRYLSRTERLAILIAIIKHDLSIEPYELGIKYSPSISETDTIMLDEFGNPSTEIRVFMLNEFGESSTLTVKETSTPAKLTIKNAFGNPTSLDMVNETGNPVTIVTKTKKNKKHKKPVK